MEATPAEHAEVADATYCTVVLTVLLFSGSVTVTLLLLEPLTWTVTGVEALPPQLSHSCTTVL
jgi:hypothetical protein